MDAALNIAGHGTSDGRLSCHPPESCLQQGQLCEPERGGVTRRTGSVRLKTSSVPTAPGEPRPKGSYVGITWSGCYPNGAIAPQVTGLTFLQAVRSLRAAGLTWACYSTGPPTTTTTVHPTTTTTVQPTTTTTVQPTATMSGAPAQRNRGPSDERIVKQARRLGKRATPRRWALAVSPSAPSERGSEGRWRADRAEPSTRSNPSSASGDDDEGWIPGRDHDAQVPAVSDPGARAHLIKWEGGLPPTSSGWAQVPFRPRRTVCHVPELACRRSLLAARRWRSTTRAASATTTTRPPMTRYHVIDEPSAAVATAAWCVAGRPGGTFSASNGLRTPPRSGPGPGSSAAG